MSIYSIIGMLDSKHPSTEKPSNPISKQNLHPFTKVFDQIKDGADRAAAESHQIHLAQLERFSNEREETLRKFKETAERVKSI